MKIIASGTQHSAHHSPVSCSFPSFHSSCLHRGALISNRLLSALQNIRCSSIFMALADGQRLTHRFELPFLITLFSCEAPTTTAPLPFSLHRMASYCGRAAAEALSARTTCKRHQTLLPVAEHPFHVLPTRALWPQCKRQFPCLLSLLPCALQNRLWQLQRI